MVRAVGHQIARITSYRRHAHGQVALNGDYGADTIKTLRGHTDDRDWMAVHRNLSAHNGGIAAKVRFPICIADYHHRICSESFALGWQNEAPESRLQAQRGEKIAGDIGRHHALWFCSFRAEPIQPKQVPG